MTPDDTIFELLRDLAESWCLDPEDLLEVFPLLPIVGSIAATSAVGWGAGKVGQKMGERAGNKAAQQAMARNEAGREDKLRELQQKRQQLNEELECMKRGNTSVNGVIHA